MTTGTSKEVIEKTSNIGLAAAYVAFGGVLLPYEADRSDSKRVKIAIRINETLSKQVQKDWYSPDDVVREIPVNVLKKFEMALRDVRDVIRG